MKDNLQKEYEKQRLEHLKNKKHERYKLQLIGEGFIIFDIINEREHLNKRGYMLIPDMFNEGYRTQKGFLTPQDLVDKMNELDFQVNGGMEGCDMAVNNREAFLELVKHKLNDILKLGAFDGEKFTVSFQDYHSFEPGDYNIINCEFKVYDKNTPRILLDDGFTRFMTVINGYLDEVEDSSDRDDSIRADTLIELKMKLMEAFNGRR